LPSISARQLQYGACRNSNDRVLAATGLPAHLLNSKSPSMVMKDVETVIATMHAFAGAGDRRFRYRLFSLAYLKLFPFAR
jgi:hypothetical protein